MKIILILAIVVVVVFFLRFLLNGKSSHNGVRQSAIDLPTVEKGNDKLIIIKDANRADVTKALTAFCDQYNQRDFAALPRLFQTSTSSFTVTFPYDCDLSIFCFAINYLKYPRDIKWHAEVKGWVTPKLTDDFITAELAGKALMVYIEKDDKEYDNVFLTTKDNFKYKLDFSGSAKPKTAGVATERYITPPNREDLTTVQYEDIK